MPKLVHAHKAKLMLGMIHKTAKLDARGLHRLQRAGTLPEVWIPQDLLQDQRELPRTRMVLVQQRTRLKNRIHATIAKHGVRIAAVSVLFGRRGRQLLPECLQALPPHSASISLASTVSRAARSHAASRSSDSSSRKRSTWSGR